MANVCMMIEICGFLLKFILDFIPFTYDFVVCIFPALIDTMTLRKNKTNSKSFIILYLLASLKQILHSREMLAVK